MLTKKFNIPLEEFKLSILIVSFLKSTFSSLIIYFCEFFGIEVFDLSSGKKFIIIWHLGSPILKIFNN